MDIFASFTLEMLHEPALLVQRVARGYCPAPRIGWKYRAFPARGKITDASTVKLPHEAYDQSALAGSRNGRKSEKMVLRAIFIGCNDVVVNPKIAILE